MKIARRTEFDREAQPVAVLPAAFQVPDRHAHLAHRGAWLFIPPHLFGFQVQTSTGRTPFRLPIQPAFEDDFFR